MADEKSILGTLKPPFCVFGVEERETGMTQADKPRHPIVVEDADGQRLNGNDIFRLINAIPALTQRANEAEKNIVTLVRILKSVAYTISELDLSFAESDPTKLELRCWQERVLCPGGILEYPLDKETIAQMDEAQRILALHNDFDCPDCTTLTAANEALQQRLKEAEGALWELWSAGERIYMDSRNTITNGEGMIDVGYRTIPREDISKLAEALSKHRDAALATISTPAAQEAQDDK